MARGLYLLSWFLTGCIAFSCIGWLGTIDESLRILMSALLALLLITYGLCWLLDDAVYQTLRLDELDYKAGLIGFGAAAALGLTIAYLVGRMSL
jgi:hypothetical protein